MADRRVRTTGKDRDGDIIKLCGPWGELDKLDACSDIENKRHTYYVQWRIAGRTEIRVVKDKSVKDGKYLRTDADQSKKNNLDDLDDC